MSPILVHSSREPLCLQYRSLENWVRSELGSVDHERRVTDIASKMFDLTWPLHGLTRDDRRMLRLAAMVHDIGRSVDDDTHPQEGARMVMKTEHLPLDPDERRALAYLTRYHRGKVPPAETDEILHRADDHDTLRRILSLLRAADALDSRAIESPRLMLELLGRRLQVTCFLEHDTPKARKVYTRRKKYRLMEELLDCRVDVRIAMAQSLRMAA